MEIYVDNSKNGQSNNKRKRQMVNIDPDIHDRIVDISRKTGLPIIRITNMLLTDALDNLTIKVVSEKESEMSESVDDVCEMARALRLGKPLPNCKDCKYFEYDSVAKVDGIPLIVAHEICSKWGDGCKTKEDGYCFLFEPKAESEE